MAKAPPLAGWVYKARAEPTKIARARLPCVRQYAVPPSAATSSRTVKHPKKQEEDPAKIPRKWRAGPPRVWRGCPQFLEAAENRARIECSSAYGQPTGHPVSRAARREAKVHPKKNQSRRQGFKGGGWAYSADGDATHNQIARPISEQCVRPLSR